jgi:hypothetical protein
MDIFIPTLSELSFNSILKMIYLHSTEEANFEYFVQRGFSEIGPILLTLPFSKFLYFSIMTRTC